MRSGGRGGVGRGVGREGGCLKYGRLEHSNVPLKHCKQNINLFCDCVSRKRAELDKVGQIRSHGRCTSSATHDTVRESDTTTHAACMISN